MRKTSDDAAARPARRSLLLTLAVVVLAIAGGAAGSPVLASLGIGGVLGALNIWLMSRLLGVVVFSGSGRFASLCGVGLGAKLLALVGAIYSLVESDLAEPVPLVIGCAACPLLHAFARLYTGPAEAVVSG